MAARIIDGKALAISLRASVRQRAERLAARGARPGLTVLLAGENPASRIYVRNKARACVESGIRSQVLEFAAGVSERELVETIEHLNRDPQVHGILVQLPLPAPLDATRVQQAVSPAKDVDGFHAASLGALVAGRPGFVPCTPAGVMHMLEHERVPLAGRRAVVIGIRATSSSAGPM